MELTWRDIPAVALLLSAVAAFYTNKIMTAAQVRRELAAKDKEIASKDETIRSLLRIGMKQADCFTLLTQQITGDHR